MSIFGKSIDGVLKTINNSILDLEKLAEKHDHRAGTAYDLAAAYTDLHDEELNNKEHALRVASKLKDLVS